MPDKKRFDRRKQAFKTLAIATAASTIVPLAGAQIANINSQSLIGKSASLPIIHNLKEPADAFNVQIRGSDFNAGQDADNGGKKSPLKSKRPSQTLKPKP